MESVYKVLSPVAESGAQLNLLAARLGSLDGKTIGMLDNSKEHAKTFLDVMAGRLRERFPGITVKRYGHQTSDRAEPELLEKIAKECDGVMYGIGD